MKDHTTKKFAYVTALNVVITVAEFIGGFVSGSLSLLSDAVHNLSDVGAIIISFVAHIISNRRSNKRKLLAMTGLKLWLPLPTVLFSF